MKKVTLAGIAVLGLLVLIVSAAPAKASPVRPDLSMGPGGPGHALSLADRFTVRDDSLESRSILESSTGCVDTRCDQHIGVFSDRIRVADVTPTGGATPEPASLVLLGSGLLIMGLAVRRLA